MLPKRQTKDLVYLCAPAKAIDEESVVFSKEFLESKGFRVELSKHVLELSNYFSGTEVQRLFDLQTGLDHPDAIAILCARGGYGCIQLLDKLDWTKFKKNPKWIIGFSDVTVLHLALSKMGIASMHATMPLNFKKNTPISLDSLRLAIQGKPMALSASRNPTNQFGQTKNIVVGGNLAIVHAMLSFLDLDFFNNKILFLEDVGEHLYQVDRMLYGLKFLGVFNKISGLIIGGFTSMADTDSPFGQTVEEIIFRHVEHRDIPVGFSFPCGHLDNNQAIILGAPAELIVTEDGCRLIQQQAEPLC
jgi:muramoyltetrapeptide carboxypeptidase